MAEKEYIERGAVVEIVSGYGLANGSTLGRHSGIADVIDERVQAIPAADVAPVVHGEWVYHECVSSYDGAISGYSCSECCSFVDEEVFESDEFHKNFCGNCGAKMDGGKA